MMSLGVCLFASILFGALCLEIDLHVYFLHQIREVFFHYFFQIDFQFLALSLFLVAPHDVNIGPLEIVPEAVYTILIFFAFYFLLFLCGCFFVSLRSKSLISFSASSTLLLFACELFFILVSVSLVSD